MPKKIIRVGSRESALAVAQTRLVMEDIQRNHPVIDNLRGHNLLTSNLFTAFI